MVQSTFSFLHKYQGRAMSYTIDIISCITDRFVELTATEKRIAQFILDDVQTAAALPISEMARQTQTSQASITRFARAIGCKDVRELKVKLAQSLAVGQRFILDVPDLEGVQGIYETIINVLDINRRALNPESLNKAVTWLSNARQILALGMGGGSTICAQELQFRLFRLGLPVVSQSDGLLARMMAASVASNDVGVALSLGGYTPEVVESAAIARQYGAKIIAITPQGTPLAEQADIVLPLIIRENDYIFKPSTSRYAMLAMIDVLATELAMANKSQAKDRLRRIKLALDSHRGGADRQPLGD
jgi:DNA-binding MurR/RpiR family transcriptional regulator